MAPRWSMVPVTSLIILGIIYSTIFPGACGLKCLSCSYTQTGTERDKECVYAPRNVTQGHPVMLCPNKYCTIYRQIMKSTGEIRSLSRSCENVNRGNECHEDVYFKTCFTTCNKKDLCNSAIPRRNGIQDGDKKTSGPVKKVDNKKVRPDEKQAEMKNGNKKHPAKVNSRKHNNELNKKTNFRDYDYYSYLFKTRYMNDSSGLTSSSFLYSYMLLVTLILM